MFGYKLHFLFLSVYFLIGTGKKHRNHALFNKKAHARNFIQEHHNRNIFPFHSTESINDLVKNPTALNKDEASEINKLDNMNDVFMNPEVSSESQDLSRQGLDPYVAMQISKLDHNFQDIFGSRGSNRPFTNAKQKGEILPGYAQQYNPDGSISLSDSEWPEYQMKDTPPMASMRKPSVDNMLLNNGLNSQQPQVSPQAALNPKLLPGQKSDLGMGMGVGMGMGMPGMAMQGKGPNGPSMSRFVNDNNNEKTPDKLSMNPALMNPAFHKPGIKSAGFRIPGEFSFKGERKSAQANEEANFVKNFMSSKKSHTEHKKKNSKE